VCAQFPSSSQGYFCQFIRMDLKKNDDVAVDLYCGPKAPAGFEKNRIPTVPDGLVCLFPVLSVDRSLLRSELAIAGLRASVEQQARLARHPGVKCISRRHLNARFPLGVSARPCENSNGSGKRSVPSRGSVGSLCVSWAKIWITDPTLPRDGTDLSPLRSVVFTQSVKSGAE